MSQESVPFSFDVQLLPTGDAGSAFRTQNDPAAPLQRDNIIERRGTLDIRCSCLDVIHGKFSADSGTFATLILLEFRFDSRKTGRRFESAEISLQFAALEGDEALSPEVYAITPSGTKVQTTSQHEEVKRMANVQLGAAAPLGGVTATGTVCWEKTISRDVSDQTTVTGSRDLVGRNWGKQNAASWTLLENRTTKTGIPSLMRTAILLKRKDESCFQCTVKIDANVDIRSKIERLFGSKGHRPKDDPVQFDPELDPTNHLQKYNTEELESADIEAMWAIATVTGQQREGVATDLQST